MILDVIFTVQPLAAKNLWFRSVDYRKWQQYIFVITHDSPDSLPNKPSRVRTHQESQEPVLGAKQSRSSF